MKLSYPHYRQAWPSVTSGDLSIDQRVRSVQLVATFGFLLPAAVLMTLAAAGAAALPDAAWVDGALLGMQVAVVGLLGHSMVGLLTKEARTLALAAVAVAAAAGGFFVNPAIVVVLAGLVGVIVDRVRRYRGGHRG